MMKVQENSFELRIAFILQNKFTLAAFSGFIDALRLAADDAAKSRQIRVGWEVYSLAGGAVHASCGVAIATLPIPRDGAGFDYVAVCGGNSFDDDRPTPALMSFIHSAHAQGVGLLGICTGSFALARAGLVASRRYCIHWNVLEAFKSRFPRAQISLDRIFADEGDVITCAGSTAAIDLALYLIVRHCGRERAQQVMRHMMLTSMRPASVPQAHFFQMPPDGTDSRVRKALYFMEQQLDQPPNGPAIARYCAISSRQLERLFRANLGQTIGQTFRNMRLNYGRYLLSGGSLSVMEIANITGFADTAHFSREFRRAFGDTPTNYRAASSPDRG
ncbi:transcriptional regulator GlxA family with amidase domain [Rhizobium sp. BIGb0125]|uniref:GlxA family transcriptional regulator n=1 Tax=Rhizobium sp. BIGb0125 TaxID=2940618 RepID=UPI00216A86C5|nr:GlxA family transcriptional regulator [Rhizobium sp. BIGb0125]MCS4245451.1 transcriptional regulator GlxA family with amidase domain [Rhizobium sp. BIGb0125]